eukprot:scaffold109253_cov72-Phaeocystis_antarctica.AAC.2
MDGSRTRRNVRAVFRSFVPRGSGADRDRRAPSSQHSGSVVPRPGIPPRTSRRCCNPGPYWTGRHPTPLPPALEPAPPPRAPALIARSPWRSLRRRRYAQV